MVKVDQQKECFIMFEVWIKVIKLEYFVCFGSLTCLNPIVIRRIWFQLFPVKALSTDRGEGYRGDKSKLSLYMTEYVHKTPVRSRPASWPQMDPAR